MFEDINLRESYAKLHEKPSETLGADLIQRLEINIYCLPRSFNGLPLYFAQRTVTEIKSRALTERHWPRITYSI